MLDSFSMQTKLLAQDDTFRTNDGAWSNKHLPQHSSGVGVA